MGTEIMFQLTRREYELLLAIDRSPTAMPACDPRTLQSLVNKGLVLRDADLRLSPAGSHFISFTRASGLFTSHTGAEEGT